jgi:predicted flap endonuclease-1-like 5' DNA nuclease
MFNSIILLEFFCEGCTLPLLFMFLGAWLLAWLFWWLFNRSTYMDRINRLDGEVNKWKGRANGLEADLSAANYEKDKFSKELAAEKAAKADVEMALRVCKEGLANAEAAAKAGGGDSGSAGDATAFMAGAMAGKMAGSGDAESTSRDVSAGGGFNFAAAFTDESNLQVVEGIGPKIEEILKNNGLANWAALAGASVAKLKEVLEGAGSRYRMHDPSTWAEQAGLAAKGEWDKLRDYQAFLGGGKDSGQTGGGDAKIEKLATKIFGFAGAKPDNLKIVEGIGPKIEGLLKDAGINDWAALAAASVEKVQGILDAAGDRYKLADPGTWPKQAALANEGKWDELKEYQDFLQGGK